MHDNLNIRKTITEKILNNIPEGDYVISPIGIWAVFAMSGYTFKEVLKNLNLSKEDAFAMLEQYTEETADTDELMIKNLIWTQDSELVKNTPESEHVGVSSPIPSQEAADKIVEEFTKGLIKEFPGDLSAALTVFTNIITMVLEWKKHFTVVNNDDMKYWNVNEIMMDKGKQKDNGEVNFVYDDDRNLFAVFTKYSKENCQVISVISTDKEIRKESAFKVLQDVVEGERKTIAAEDLFAEDITQRSNFSITKTRAENDSYSVQIPAWELDVTTDLNNLFLLPPNTSMIQKAVAKYQVSGFKAAAVTAMMTRSAMIMGESYDVCLDFDKPFASAAVYESENWSNIPAFISWTESAVEPKDED